MNWLSNYHGRSTIFALVKNKDRCHKLISNKLHVMFFENRQAVFLPEEKNIYLTEEEANYFEQQQEYDVFQLNNDGKLFLYMIFLCGIHGSGKTHLCKQIQQKSEIPFFSASKLIAEYKHEIYTSNKLIQDINANQIALLSKVNELKSKGQYILDSHLCLLDKLHNICRINEEDITALAPDCILVNTCDVNVIYERLKTRDNQEYSIDMLSEFQNSEVKYAKEISNILDINHYVISNNNSIDEIIKVIRSIKYGRYI